MSKSFKQYRLDTQYIIWDTEYNIKDYEDWIEVELPCTKTDELGGTILSSYFKKVTNQNTIDLIRLCIKNNSTELISKDETRSFYLREIVEGIPTEYGWRESDFLTE